MLTIMRVSLLAWLTLMPQALFAGPITEFETAMQSAYADYRAALFQTNRKDQVATQRALDGFSTKWRDLSSRWGKSPPPHLQEDAQWSTTLTKVEAIAAQAQQQAARNELTEAHETLEAIRDEIGGMRKRNGLVTFSDRMNAYHEKMEHVLARPKDAFEASGLGLLREDTAVLTYLVNEIEHNAPDRLKADPKFSDALRALKASVSALTDATRAGDAAAASKALEGLKQPYSRMFLQFG